MNEMLSRMRKTVEAAMAGDGTGSPVFDGMLGGMAALYGTGVRIRSRLYDRGMIQADVLPRPVISIGNITVGGTGKTPLTIHIARHLLEKGCSPVILSRGYGGSASAEGGVACDGRTVLMDAARAGDEPVMMAQALGRVPVMVGRNRFRSGQDALNRFSPDLFILDDGFQHRKLSRNLNILLMDSTNPFGNGFLLPRGALREPPESVLRADAVVLTRSDDRDGAIRRFRAAATGVGIGTEVMNLPVFTCSRIPEIRGVVEAGGHILRQFSPPEIGGDGLFAFSGIARNDDFRKGLGESGFTVAGWADFPDHHPFGPDDMAKIVAEARSAGAAMLATTEKDWVRLSGGAPLPMDLLVMGVALDFGADHIPFLEHINQYITLP
jgi:tetraacyldisaccharide 4'-kinase